ncbi:MAG TPA: TetR/AcrR family transcriptional regulator [Actinomycetes bacterium]
MTQQVAEGRSARKRRDIMEAATTLFLRNGYLGTSMDEVAALAAVSKQTVYKHFADKERLFTDIVLGVTGVAGEFVDEVVRTLPDSDDLERDLVALGRRYVAAVMQPQVLQMRRLLVGECARFPALARAYYERAPERTIAALAAAFGRLDERGLLHVDDPQLAAGHFAFLVLGMALDRAMLCGDGEAFGSAELERLADAGVRAFLAAYGRP